VCIYVVSSVYECYCGLNLDHVKTKHVAIFVTEINLFLDLLCLRSFSVPHKQRVCHIRRVSANRRETFPELYLNVVSKAAIFTGR